MNTNQIAVHVNNAARLGMAPVSPLQPLVDLILAGYSVDLDDGPMTGNGHRYRYLVVNGAHIGMRESLGALANLARRCNGLDAAGLRALQSAEMDREDAAKANPDSALAKAYARSC